MRQGSLKDNPLLDPILVRALADVNVVTVEGLLCEDHRSLVAQGLAEEQLEESLLACATFYGGHQTTLSEVVHGELGPEFRPCGQKDFDEFMGGGLPNGKIVEIVGPTGVGKTQLCLWMAMKVALEDENGGVVFITSSNTVSASRLLSFAPDFLNEDVRLSALARIQIINCFDYDSLTHHLSALLEQSLHQGRLGLHPNRDALFIIDSIAPLLQPTLGKTPFGHSLMFSIRAILLEIAAAHNAAIVVTNFLATADWTTVTTSSSSSSSSSSNVRSAMGPSWASVANVRMWIFPGNESEHSIVTMRGVGALQRSCDMQIGDHGIVFTPRC